MAVPEHATLVTQAARIAITHAVVRGPHGKEDEQYYTHWFGHEGLSTRQKHIYYGLSAIIRPPESGQTPDPGNVVCTTLHLLTVKRKGQTETAVAQFGGDVTFERDGTVEISSGVSLISDNLAEGQVPPAANSASLAWLAGKLVHIENSAIQTRIHFTM